MENELRIVAWNCNGLTQDKLGDKNFVNTIKSSDIAILSETWTCKDSDTEIDGYFCYNFNRKYRHRRAKRNSGGMAIFIRNEYRNGITVVKNHFDTIIRMRIDKTFFSLESDLYLCGLYLWPDESPITSVFDDDVFDILSSDVYFFDQYGSVLLAGDWNCRVGHKGDFIQFDSFVDYLDFDEYVPDTNILAGRASSDNTCNARGTRMIDFCRATSLRIANGRIGDDCNKRLFTYYCRNTCSIIDYLVLKEKDFSLVKTFQIFPFSEYSDHAPLYFSLHINKACEPVNTHNNFDCAHSFTFYKWDEEKKNAFRRDIISKLPSFNTLLTETDCSIAESVESLVDNFSSLIERSAEPYFKHTCSRKCGIVRNTVHKEWFDQECVVMKQRYVQALRSFNTSKTVENRHVLCNYKAESKTLIRKKKRQFKIRKARELYDMRRKNPKQFWKHFNSQKCNISSNISADHFQEYFSTMLFAFKS